MSLIIDFTSLCDLCKKEKYQEKIEGMKMCEICAAHFSYSGLLAHEKTILMLSKRLHALNNLAWTVTIVAFLEFMWLLKIYL